ncbi:MAG TPA: DUF624 domain-containing protein [Actinopolymorphaceae bacterium]|jgi:uncharacterized membrane protein YesL|nr:DUF624 domain-containing protein [Actinopolymorphaceae bacterium]
MAYFNRVMEAAFTIAVAGLLWLLAGVPLVTLGPSTAALYSVMEAWGEDGPPPVWSTFWSGFRTHFRQAMAVGLLASAAAGLLLIDLMYGLRADGAPMRAAVMVAAILGVFAVGGTLMFVFPVMVCHPGPWRLVVRNSALFAAAYPLSTLAGLLLVAAASFVVGVVPMLLPVAAGFVGWAVMRLDQRAFARLLARQEAQRAAQSTTTT